MNIESTVVGTSSTESTEREDFAKTDARLDEIKGMNMGDMSDDDLENVIAERKALRAQKEEMMGTAQVEATTEEQERSEAEKMATETVKVEAEVTAQDEKAKQIEERKLAEAIQIEALIAEIKGEKVEEVESQDQLASDYLAAYDKYREIADRRNNDLRILDRLRDEAISPNLIAEQEKLFAASMDEEKEAMNKYAKIGEKLTIETKDKYLVSQDQLASDYLVAYGEYKKLNEEYMQNLRVLDGMKNEQHLTDDTTKAESNIVTKEKEQALLSQKMNEAMKKYSKISEKLTDETKEKYLK